MCVFFYVVFTQMFAVVNKEFEEVKIDPSLNDVVVLFQASSEGSVIASTSHIFSFDRAPLEQRSL